MLEISSYPFATKILEAIKRNEESMAAGQAPQGIPPELLAQLQGQQSGAGQPQQSIQQPTPVQLQGNENALQQPVPDFQ